MQTTEKKSFLFPHKTITLTDSSPLPNSIASYLESFFLANESLLPFYRKHFSASDTLFLKDLRGRAPENFASTDKHLPPKPPRDEQQLEELFYLEGLIKEEPSESGEDTEPRPFSLSIYSQFQSFDGSKHILYRCIFNFEKELLEILETPSLSCALEDNPKIEITFARLGLEFFGSSFLGSLVGSMPSVKTRFYLELEAGALKVFAEDRVGKDRGLSVNLKALLEQMQKN